METYKNEFDIEIEKINELEILCKNFNLKKLETPHYLTIYKNDDILVQNITKEGKSKILICSNQKETYNSFMNQFNEIYQPCKN
jgi:hypothetical protein